MWDIKIILKGTIHREDIKEILLKVGDFERVSGRVCKRRINNSIYARRFPVPYRYNNIYRWNIDSQTALIVNVFHATRTQKVKSKRYPDLIEKDYVFAISFGLKQYGPVFYYKMLEFEEVLDLLNKETAQELLFHMDLFGG